MTTMNTPLRRLLIAMLVLFAVQALTSNANSSSHNIRDNKGQPVEGVTVIFTWEATRDAPADAKAAKTYCSGFAVTRSDKNGAYASPAQSQYGGGGGTLGPHVFYKKGYTPYYDNQAQRTLLKADDGSFDAVFPVQGKYGNGFGCMTLGNFKKAGMDPVLLEIIEEYQKRAKTNKDGTRSGAMLLIAFASESSDLETYKRAVQALSGEVVTNDKKPSAEDVLAVKAAWAKFISRLKAGDVNGASVFFSDNEYYRTRLAALGNQLTAIAAAQAHSPRFLTSGNRVHVYTSQTVGGENLLVEFIFVRDIDDEWRIQSMQ